MIKLEPHSSPFAGGSFSADQAIELGTSVRTEVLRKLETEMCERRLLPEAAASLVNPLWFLAETERNTYLWRRGLSIIQEDEFEFWIDVEKLISKRLRQLDSPEQGNPFHNPLWSIWENDSESLRIEREYLQSFSEQWQRISLHAHALSCVAAEIEASLGAERGRKVVVIPAG